MRILIPSLAALFVFLTGVEARVPQAAKEVPEAKAAPKLAWPAAVEAAFKKSYPNATVKAVLKEVEAGKTIYEVESIDAGRRRDINYNADGSVNAAVDECDSTRDRSRGRLKASTLIGGAVDGPAEVSGDSERSWPAFAIVVVDGQPVEPAGHAVEEQLHFPHMNDGKQLSYDHFNGDAQAMLARCRLHETRRTKLVQDPPETPAPA